jgi:hypothetical protein
MNKFKTATVVLAAGVLLLVAATALADQGGAYTSRKDARPPYLSIAVSGGVVTRVVWDVKYVCGDGGVYDGFHRRTVLLNAAITNGRFSKRIKDRPPRHIDSAYTRVSGTVTGGRASVKLTDTLNYEYFEGSPGLGGGNSPQTCDGSGKFSLGAAPGSGLG